MNTIRGLFYGVAIIAGVIMPWVWASAFVALLLDYIVRYLAGGREAEIIKLIKAHTTPLELEIERLKNQVKDIQK
jgi:hypothetical protein